MKILETLGLTAKLMHLRPSCFNFLKHGKMLSLSRKDKTLFSKELLFFKYKAND